MTSIHLTKIHADARAEDLFAAAERRRHARRRHRRHATAEPRQGEDLPPLVAALEVPRCLGQQ